MNTVNANNSLVPPKDFSTNDIYLDVIDQLNEILEYLIDSKDALESTLFDRKILGTSLVETLSRLLQGTDVFQYDQSVYGIANEFSDLKILVKTSKLTKSTKCV